MQTAHYLNRLVTTAVPDLAFGQEALEWAILEGVLRLTYDLNSDLKLLMERYDYCCDLYHSHLFRGRDLQIAA